MGLFKIIKKHISPAYDLYKYMHELRKEAQDNNISPINSIYIEQLSDEYFMGYPLSMYLLFNEIPEAKITSQALHKLNTEISQHMLYQLNQEKKYEFYYRPKDIAAYALYKKIKIFNKDAKLYRADLRAYGEGYYVEDGQFAYDPTTAKKMPIDSFKRIYNPQDIKEVVETAKTNIIDELTTKDNDKLLDDVLDYVSDKELDILYEEAIDNLLVSDDIHKAKLKEIKKYFKEINYNYHDGLIFVPVK